MGRATAWMPWNKIESPTTPATRMVAKADSPLGGRHGLGEAGLGALRVRAHGAVDLVALGDAGDIMGQEQLEGGEVAVGGDGDDAVGTHRRLEPGGGVEGQDRAVVHDRDPAA